MHRVRAGGAIATKRIASTLDLKFEEAEILKRGITKEDKTYADVRRAHNSVYERALQEFRQVIREYEQALGTNISTVYLTGGGSTFSGLNTAMAEILSKEVVYVNAFNKVAYPAFMEDMMTELAPTFHVALGAALRNFE
jgi:Tfp pilus assembly PilM family ATPase